MKKQHKILREQFNIKEDELLENERRWTKEDRQCGFSVCETWSLEYSFVCWLAERVYRYKEIGGEVVNLKFHIFHYKGKEYNQLELIDILLDKCDQYFKTQLWEDGHEDIVEDICDIWKELLPAMWW